MSRPMHMLSQNISLAAAIISTLQNPPVSSIFESKSSESTTQFVEQLLLLDLQGRGNEIESVVYLLKTFQKIYDHSTLLTQKEKEAISSFFKDNLTWLYELSFNIQRHGIAIQNPTDAFTLNHTCHYILVLDNVMNDLYPTSYFVTNNRHRKPSAFAPAAIPTSVIAQELHIASELKKDSESIRSQIGSPETTPRSLLIELMSALCDAQELCQKIYDEYNVQNRRLLHAIETAISELAGTYPDLADAGEKLHEAIANNPFTK